MLQNEMTRKETNPRKRFPQSKTKTFLGTSEQKLGGIGGLIDPWE